MTDALAEPKAKGSHIWQRDGLDWYVEELRASAALFRVERFVGAVWDPSCGQGNIIRSAREAGLSAIGSDIVARPGADGWVVTRDFLKDESGPLAPNLAFNPPFFRGVGAEAFIRHALSLASGKVCAFVDLKFLAGIKRAGGLYTEHRPHRCWIITPRVSCPPGEYLLAGNKAGGGTADWIWLVWDLTAPPSTGMITDWLDVSGVPA